MALDIQLEIERRRHVQAINELLAHSLPLFPHKARVTSIAGGTVFVAVLEQQDLSRASFCEEPILSLIQEYGVTSASRLSVSVSREFSRYSASVSITSLLPNYPMVERAARLSDFEAAFAKRFGPPFPEHAQLANYSQGTLTVTVRSSAFATRLRMEQERLLATAREMGISKARKVAITITPPSSPPAPPARKPNPVTRATATAIMGTAQTLPDEPLAHALARLGQTLQAKAKDS